MNIVTLFEQLAASVHHNIVISEMISDQSNETKEAFFTNNAEQLKRQFGDTGGLADKDKVVQISR